MSLLQDPVRALDQVDWYLQNTHLERFPGAYLKAAGNLSRQVLEQTLFILCFYGGLSRNRYMRPDGRLKTAAAMLDALSSPGAGQVDPFRVASARGPRVAKFARCRRRFRAWLKHLNEPSHFRSPVARVAARRADIEKFVSAMRLLFDDLDGYLIVAAFNELVSDGRVRAVFSTDARNTPGAEVTVTVTTRCVVRDENGLPAIKAPAHPIRIVRDDADVSLRKSKAVVLVRGTANMHLVGRLVNEIGHPIDLTNAQTVLNSLAYDDTSGRKLVRRLRRLGFRADLSSSS